MPPASGPNPLGSAGFESAELPPGRALFPALDADGLLRPEGIATPYEQPRIELPLPPREAVATAVAMARHVASGRVSAALVYHRAESGLHLLEIRLDRIEDRAAVWRDLAGCGLRGLRWLVPPCNHDIWGYCVVQGPIAWDDWGGIIGTADDAGCTHLVVLDEKPVRRWPRGFSGTVETVAADPDGTAAPAWLESAAVAFRAEREFSESDERGLLLASGRETTVVRARENMVVRDGDWCVLSPGPYGTGRSVAIVIPRAGTAMVRSCRG